MKKEEMVKGLTYLGLAYNYQYTQEECELYYDFLQDYHYQTFVAAVKNLIRRSKFIPKVNELIDECNNCKEVSKIKVIEYMNSKGYFKTSREYDKTIVFMERGIVPDWLQADINKYYKMMVQPALNNQETLLIG